jgi:hypothetical protein
MVDIVLCRKRYFVTFAAEMKVRKFKMTSGELYYFLVLADGLPYIIMSNIQSWFAQQWEALV